jgi:hypothetical protein
LGIIKIQTEEFLNDFGTNATETMIVGSDQKEVADYMQKHSTREFRRFGTLMETDGLLSKYEVKHVWTRIKKILKKYPQLTIKKPSENDLDLNVFKKLTRLAVGPNLISEIS